MKQEKQTMTTTATHTPGPWHVVPDTTRQTILVDIAAPERGGNQPVAENVLERDGPIIAAAPELLEALKGMNHMGGDERGGYCICPRHDGSAPDGQHSTNCVMARQAIAKAEGK